MLATSGPWESCSPRHRMPSTTETAPRAVNHAAGMIPPCPLLPRSSSSASGFFFCGMREDPVLRGLHSSTFWLNLSAFCGIGGACRGGLGGVQEMLGGIRGCAGCILCQKRLRLS